MLLSGFDVHLRFGLRILGNLKIVEGNGTFVVQNFRAIELLADQDFVGAGLAILRKRCGDVGALHAKQHLSFFHGVAEARANFHHAPAGERDHGNGAADVRADNAGNGERRGLQRLGSLYQRKLFRMLHLKDADVGFLFHLCLWRSTVARRSLSAAARL